MLVYRLTHERVLLELLLGVAAWVPLRFQNARLRQPRRLRL